MFMNQTNENNQPSCIDDFHVLYYNNRARTWQNTFFMGVPVFKCPLDLWIYQEIIWDIKPDLIIECGTARGGSALYLASICSLIKKGHVVTVDIYQPPDSPKHERISYLQGSSTSPEIVEQIKKFTDGQSVVLVILDSDHSKDHVFQELCIYSSFIHPGSYIIVEDTNINGHPVRPDFGQGPHEAVNLFLKEHPSFIQDREREKLFVTFNPGGYLRCV